MFRLFNAHEKRCVDIEFELPTVNGYRVQKEKIRVCKKETIESILLGTGCVAGEKTSSVVCTDNNGVKGEFKKFKLCYESEKECAFVKGDTKIKCNHRKGDDGRECDSIVIKAESSEKLKRKEEEECNECYEEIKPIIDRNNEMREKVEKCMPTEEAIIYDLNQEKKS